QRHAGRRTRDDLERAAVARFSDAGQPRYPAESVDRRRRCPQEDERRDLLAGVSDLRSRESYQLQSGDGDARPERQVTQQTKAQRRTRLSRAPFFLAAIGAKRGFQTSTRGRRGSMPRLQKP